MFCRQEARTMAYDDSRFRGEPGFRDEPDFRVTGVPEDAPTLGGTSSSSIYSPGSYPVSDYGPSPSESSLGMSGRRAAPSPAQLDEVFDDPEHGEPGRDRMAVHAIWEVILLLAAAAVIFLLRDTEPAALRGAALQDLLLLAAEIGVVAVAVGLSLRAGAVNLAVGPIAYGAALFFADNSDGGLAVTAGITALLALGVGAAIAVVVTAFHVPSWAASLAAALGLLVWVQQHRPEQVVNGAYDPSAHAWYWFGGFAALALLGGLLGMFKPIRRAVGRFRPVADPARRRGGAAAVLTALAIVGSSILAAGGGVLIALDSRSVSPAADGLALTGVALGAALLGGTSAFGRRGGILGTVLAVVLIVAVVRFAAAEGRALNQLAVAAVTIAVGLIVTRLVEAFGRPRTAIEHDDEPEWTPGTNAMGGDTGWSSSRTGGWTSQLPARTTDEGWGVQERWGTR
jgi:ribose/xylose/arabinose/galactoside ABC-type transport system permease subunit